MVIAAFAIPLGIALGPRGARFAHALALAIVLAVSAAVAWAGAGITLPSAAFDPIWHVGLFGIALPLSLARITDRPMPRPLAAMYGFGVAIAALGLALAGAPLGHAMVEAGRGLFAWAILLSALAWNPRVRSAAWWIAAASLATVANSVRELAGGLPSDAAVSDSVRHVFAVAGVALPLCALAAPRAARAVAILGSLSAGLRLAVAIPAYGHALFAPAARLLVAASGGLGVAAVLVALVAASIDTPHRR